MHLGYYFAKRLFFTVINNFFFASNDRRQNPEPVDIIYGDILTEIGVNRRHSGAYAVRAIAYLIESFVFQNVLSNRTDTQPRRHYTPSPIVGVFLATTFSHVVFCPSCGRQFCFLLCVANKSVDFGPPELVTDRTSRFISLTYVSLLRAFSFLFLFLHSTPIVLERSQHVANIVYSTVLFLLYCCLWPECPTYNRDVIVSRII